MNKGLVFFVGVVIILLIGGSIQSQPEDMVNAYQAPETTTLKATTTTTSTTTTSTTTTTLTILPISYANYTMSYVPLFYQERRNTCGQASVQMVLAYYNITKTQLDISLGMGRFGRTRAHDLVMYLNRQGLNARIVEDFKPYVTTEDKPIIVLNGIKNHWVVVRKEVGDYYFLNNPSGGYRFWEKNKTLHWYYDSTPAIIVEGWN